MNVACGRHEVRGPDPPAPARVARLLLPDARVARGGRGPRAGGVPAGMAGSRGAFEERASGPDLAVPHRTNPCLDALRRTTPPLQPYPDLLLDERPGPDAVAVGRETICLAFLAAIQLLPPPPAGPCSSCATCCPGRRARQPPCSTRPCRRSTAPCSGPGDAARAVAGRSPGVGGRRRTGPGAARGLAQDPRGHKPINDTQPGRQRRTISEEVVRLCWMIMWHSTGCRLPSRRPM
jgi:hypothetical protein